jgi:putative ABC transport system permease protein
VTPRRFFFIDKGRTFPPKDAAEVILNADFARGMDAVVHPASAPVPPVEQMAALMGPDRDGALNGENVVLGATYPSFQPGDKRAGMAPLWLAQRMLRMEGRVTTYALNVDSLEQLDSTRDAVQAALGPDFEVQTWNEIFPFLKTMMGTQDFIFSILSGVFLSVVLLGIVNAMLMTVLERTREIGTMLAVGMRRRQVVSLFLLEGAVQGLVGGLLGVALGTLLVHLLAHFGINLPAPGASVSAILRPFVTPMFVFGVAVGAPLGASFACLWPAWRASRLRPVEALQSL